MRGAPRLQRRDRLRPPFVQRRNDPVSVDHRSDADPARAHSRHRALPDRRPQHRPLLDRLDQTQWSDRQDGGRSDPTGPAADADHPDVAGKLGAQPACFLLREKEFESVSRFAPLAWITKMTWMNQSILVVDDDPVVRELVSEYLVGRGFKVSTLEHGMALQRSLQDERPAL